MLSIKGILTLPADIVMLAGQKQLAAKYGHLKGVQSIDLANLLSPLAEWTSVADELAGLMERGQETSPVGGALNRGDRRAVYHLIRALKPTNVLEIGTHLGSSTIHIAAALRENARRGRGGNLTSVDVIDVNAEKGPWARGGLKRSPRQMVEALGMGDQVSFRIANSIRYLKDCQVAYDFVFLDGSHAASAVYNEIQLVQSCLRAGAVILLHDFFPNRLPLWAGSKALPGPWLACMRLLREGAPIQVVPLGQLPWPTKAGSTVTSLALLLGASQTSNPSA